MLKNFLDSAKNIKDLRKLSAMALLLAVYVALYAFPIPLGQQLRITFTFIPVAISGWLFGICPAVLVSAIGDLLSCLIFPQGAYFYGYTVTAVLSGIFSGLFLYKKEGNKTILGVVLSRVFVTLLLNTLLNSYWATFFVPKSIFVIMSGKFIKNITMLPVEIIVLFAIIKALSRAKIQKMYK